MSTTNTTPADIQATLEAAKAEEAAVKEWLNLLSHATDLPDIRSSVERLRLLLGKHFEDTESPDGLYEELIAIEPITASKVEGLVAEHAELREQLKGLRGLLDAATEAMLRLSEAKEAFIKHVKECDATERSLVLDAYYMDLGGGD